MAEHEFSNPQRLTKPMVKATIFEAFGVLKISIRDKILWDTEVKGFGLRVTRNGAKSYVFKYRLGRGRNGVSKQIRSGGGDMHPEKARGIARDWRELVAKGGDPAAKRDELATAPTVAQLCDDYMERHAKPNKRESSWRHDQSNINRYIKPVLGKIRVRDVTTRDVEDLHRSIVQAPTQANRVLTLVSKMFSLAIRWEWRPNNPAKGVAKNREEKRQRFLSPNEIKALSDALESYVEGAPRHDDACKSVNAIKLIMLTGARKGEVMSARWDQFDLDGGVWTKPSSHTKQKQEHRVPISPPAVTLLQEISKNGQDPSDYVFPARTGNTGHVTELKRAWRAVSEIAGIEDVRIHDLRHTYASILASGGMSLPIIGALLGHTQPQSTARYSHLYDDPLRVATERVAAAYGHGSEVGAEIVDFPTRNP
jgi:integrase